MIAQVKAELLKIRSTRTTLGLIAGMLALVLLLVSADGAARQRRAFWRARTPSADLLGLGGVAGIFSALAGLLVVTGEYRHGTIRPTLSLHATAAARPWRQAGGEHDHRAGVSASSPRRSASRWARRSWPAVACRLPLAAARPRSSSLGTIVGVVLWGGLGVGLGAILRNQVAAVIALLAWAFIIENLIFGLAPSVGRYGPEQAATALAGMTTGHLLLAGRRRRRADRLGGRARGGGCRTDRAT